MFFFATVLSIWKVNQLSNIFLCSAGQSTGRSTGLVADLSSSFGGSVAVKKKGDVRTPPLVCIVLVVFFLFVFFFVFSFYLRFSSFSSKTSYSFSVNRRVSPLFLATLLFLFFYFPLSLRFLRLLMFSSFRYE